MLNRVDGGGAAPKPTDTSGSGSLAATKAADRAATPSALDIFKKKVGPGTTTAFTRTPTKERSTDAPDLGAALRGRAKAEQVDKATEGPKPTPTSTSDDDHRAGKGKGAGSRPSAAAAVADESAERRGEATSNDGRADTLNTDGHEGTRDQQIKDLKAKQLQLVKEQDSIQGEIDDLEEQVKDGEGKADVVGTVVSVATSPVSAVFGLFGKSNPVADAASSVAENALGVDEKRDELKEEQQRLKEQQQQIEEQIAKLSQERVLNFLADVAHTTDMPDAVADFIEGDSNLKIKVEDEVATESDAMYSSDDDTVHITTDVVAKTEDTLKQLQDQGIVDGDGNIIDAARFDQSELGDKAISSAALVGVHEVTHGAQDEHGKMGAASATIETQLSEDLAQAAVAPGAAGAAMRDEAYKQAEMRRIDLLEYDAYTNQETIELQAGKKKQGFITINPDGSTLPREQAVENIFQFQQGLPLVYGTSAGVVPGGDDAEHDHDATAHDDETPGRWTPGRWTPGDEAPGRWTPGSLAPGRWTPGDEAPGRWTPGSLAPGRWTPGDEAPGRWTPGFETD